MKKIILAIIMLVLSVSLFACAKKSDSEPTYKPVSSATVIPTAGITVTPDANITDTPVVTVTPTADITSTIKPTNTPVTESAPTPTQSVYTQFLPQNAIKQMFDNKGGLAYYDGAQIYYENGEYKTARTAPCVSENGKLYITTNAHGKKTPAEMAVALGAEYVIYDDKLVVFSYKKDFVDVFSDVYTLEALTLYLKGADEADVVNAFITLPNFVSNGTTNSVYYTEPNLNLGLQTEIYSLALEGYDTGYGEVVNAPMIMAGQGEDSANNTLVRIFNEEQACISQFLAFQPEVKGGVQVKAGYSESGEALITTAAYNGSKQDAKSIKVFDTSGLLRYSFVPEGIDAPYAIEVGKFISDSDEYFIFVSSLAANGSNSKYALYSLNDGSFIKAVQGGFNSGITTQRITLSAYSPDNSASGSQKIIVTFIDSDTVYYLDCKTSKWTKNSITLSDNVTGVYASAFSGELIGSTDEETYSNIRVYGSGVSGNATGKLLNVGDKENHFYSSFAESNPDGFIDYASFQHLRTDLDNQASYGMTQFANDPQQLFDYFDNVVYGDWEYVLSRAQKKLYRSQYNMWEPCFTHRWNKLPWTTVLSQAVNKGFPAYTSIGRDNAEGMYEEINSQYFIGTYADGIIELAKMRIYPLRMMLQQLAVEFRGENGKPEQLVALSPVHEHEINVDGSVGDYHPNMITGFGKYLLSLYGSVENINQRFGTNFASEEEIDAPRYDPNGINTNASRGQWDVYGGSDYFTQWSLYTRNIVNKRILEAYREALLAGFPPEAINAHQIPEGDAVSGFLGQADTRISPTDVVSICGTAYGGTRYGYFWQGANNFIALAYAAGHNNITMGEYSTLTEDYTVAYTQLKYVFNNGVKYTQVMPFSEAMEQAERQAVKMLQEENQPRSASTGGTGAVVPVYRGENSYNIVQIGDADLNGLLKSVKQDGTWEGSVYIVPFHSQVEIKSIDMNKQSSGYISDSVTGMQYGDQIELTFNGYYTGKGTAAVKIEVYHAGYLIEDATAKYALASDTTLYRYVFSNQLAMEDIEIRITYECQDKSKIKTENLQCTLQTEKVAHKYFGDVTGMANKGGVSFDIIE